MLAHGPATTAARDPQRTIMRGIGRPEGSCAPPSDPSPKLGVQPMNFSSQSVIHRHAGVALIGARRSWTINMAPPPHR